MRTRDAVSVVLAVLAYAGGVEGHVGAQPDPAGDQPRTVTARVRHVVAIVLPVGVGIVEVVSGDAEYWDVTAAANMAFVRPLREGIRSNVLILTDTGAILPLVVIEEAHTEAAGRAVATVVRLDVPAEPATAGLVAGEEVRAARQRAAAAWAEVSAAEERAAERLAAARFAAVAELDEIRESYPRRLEFVYRLPAVAATAPWHVEAMWHDGDRTFIRSAAEGMVVLDWIDGALVEVEASMSGRGWYVVPRVLGLGALDVGGQRVRWVSVGREVGP